MFFWVLRLKDILVFHRAIPLELKQTNVLSSKVAIANNLKQDNIFIFNELFDRPLKEIFHYLAENVKVAYEVIKHATI